MSCLENKIDIFCIEETWLKSHIESEFRGYNVIRQYRIHTHKGGVLIGIKKNFHFTEIELELDEEVGDRIELMAVDRKSVV